MRYALLATCLAAAFAAPAFAQQAPEPTPSLPPATQAEPSLGRNYDGLPFVYDLVGRLEPYPVRVLDPETRERAKPCESAMMRELRRSGLAENGKAVYRRCVQRLGLPDTAPERPGVRPAR